ncbi:unnamed protein product [Diplocarpon coronariae]|nr:hypothetical protein JHW43_005270 [Diplocarpon mali]
MNPAPPRLETGWSSRTGRPTCLEEKDHQHEDRAATRDLSPNAASSTTAARRGLRERLGATKATTSSPVSRWPGGSPARDQRLLSRLAAEAAGVNFCAWTTTRWHVDDLGEGRFADGPALALPQGIRSPAAAHTGNRSQSQMPPSPGKSNKTHDYQITLE